MKQRLDMVLVEKGFFESREKAKRAIMAGIIIVGDKKVDKAGEMINPESEIRIKGEVMPYVSRGGLKLEKAIKEFKLDFTGKRIIDIGASTGGFTDCSLQNGAAFVYSIDVGTNQLDWKLRQNTMVKSIENRHIRDLKIDEIDNEKCDIIVVDVSFISLTSIFESMTKLIKNDGIIVTLIKPQFEVGRENIDKGGIVKDFSKHYMAINNVSNIALKFGYFLDMLTISPITGTKGNVEYLALFRYGDDNKNIDIDGIISQGKKLKKGAENDE